MYSHEIQQVLETYNYNILSETYLKICATSPQINQIKFEPYEQSYELWTNDDFYWKFKVYKSEIIL